MITSPTDYVDGEHTVQEQEPTTIAELEALGIPESQVVAECVSNLYYRNKYPRVYKKVSEEIAKTFPRPQAVDKEGKPVVKKSKDGTETPVPASPLDHIRDYEKIGAEAVAHVDSLLQTLAPAEPLFVKGERTPGGGKISKMAMDGANNFLAQGEEVVDEKVTFIEEAVGGGYKIGRDADGKVTAESFARGIQAYSQKLEADAKAAAKRGLGL